MMLSNGTLADKPAYRNKTQAKREKSGIRSRICECTQLGQGGPRSAAPQLQVPGSLTTSTTGRWSGLSAPTAATCSASGAAGVRRVGR
jgi:hypothetical protein